MSYDAMPAFDAIQNGFALDGTVITAAFAALSDMARALAGDVLGKSCWLFGGEVSGRQSGNDLFAEVDAGDWYVEEPGSLMHRGITAATRSRQPQRSVQVDQGTDRLLSFQPNAADDRLGALIQTDAYRVRPPEGAVPIAWCGVGFTDLHAVIDARPHPVLGTRVEVSGTNARSRRLWVPVTDGRLAVVLYRGEQLEVSLSLTAKDGLVAAFADNDRLPHERTDMTQVVVALNGLIVDDDVLLSSLLGVGFATTVPDNRTHYAEWVIDPFLANGGTEDGSPTSGPTLADQVFKTLSAADGTLPPKGGGPTAEAFAALARAGGGTVLCELFIRGYDVSIQDCWLGLRVRPKERVPV